MAFIDTHLHIDAPEFGSLRQAQDSWLAARQAGVGHAVVPAVRAANFGHTLAVANALNLDVALGLHPVYLAEHEAAHLALLQEHLAAGDAIAVGECGLDFYVPGLDPLQQERLLLAQLKLARRYDLPVILHIRRAQDRVLKCLRQVPVRGGIAHAFNGSEQQAQAFIDLGFCLGIGGAMTYQGSQRIRRLASTLPIQALVLETDGPDMSPQWARGEVNLPSNLVPIAEALAALRNMPLLELAQQTCANAYRVLPGLRRL